MANGVLITNRANRYPVDQTRLSAAASACDTSCQVSVSSSTGRPAGSHIQARNSTSATASPMPIDTAPAGRPPATALTAITETSTVKSAMVSTSLAPSVDSTGTFHRRWKYTGATTLVSG